MTANNSMSVVVSVRIKFVLSPTLISSKVQFDLVHEHLELSNPRAGLHPMA
jgi:hypothetical protein